MDIWALLLGRGGEDEARRSVLQPTIVQLIKLMENACANVDRTARPRLYIDGKELCKMALGEQFDFRPYHFGQCNVQNSAICKLRTAPKMGTCSHMFIFPQNFFIQLKRRDSQQDNIPTANEFF